MSWQRVGLVTRWVADEPFPEPDPVELCEQYGLPRALLKLTDRRKVSAGPRGGSK